MPAERPRLRKREIAIALAAGALAAGGAALVLDEDVGPDRREPTEQADTELVYDLRDFTQVSVAGPHDVDISLGDKFLVTAYGDPDAINQLEAVVEDGVLIIRPRESASINFDDLDDVRFAVSLPAITRVNVEGAGEVTLDRVTGESFEGTIGGNGSLAIAQLEVTRATLAVNGSGDLDAEGAVEDAAISINGSGEIHAGGLRSTRGMVSIAGSGEVQLTALEQADVSITGSAQVDISGTAVCSVTQVGSGEVRCEGGGGDVLD